VADALALVPPLPPLSQEVLDSPPVHALVDLRRESGRRCRPVQPDWVREIRDQCVDAGVPFFFKQWGGRTPKSGGRTLDGRESDEFPA
jgi:protein gp37